MYQCPMCGSVELETMFTLHDISVFVNILADEYEEAIHADTGNHKLKLYSYRGFPFNADFVLEKVQYSQDYHSERRSLLNTCGCCDITDSRRNSVMSYNSIRS